MIRTYQYKLYNNNSYQRKFTRWVGCCRLVYNLAKECKEFAYRQYNVSLGKYDLINQLPELKNEYEWLKEVSSQTLQAVIERLDKAFQNFYNGAGYPKWAKKHKYKSIKFKQAIKQTNDGFKLPKFGKVKVFNKEYTFNGTIKCAIMIRKADGLYLNVIVESKDTEVTESQGTIGIDMGITHFCTLSDGTQIQNPKHLSKYLNKIRIESRSLSRKKKGSKNWIKQKKKLSCLYKKVKDTRRDFLHKLSTKLSKEYNTVIVEDLDINNMYNKYLSRYIDDCGWGLFFYMLDYKTNLKKVNPKHTSQMCFDCGNVSSENRKTQSEFKCVKCGYKNNADVNAAKNIKRLGHEPCGDNVGARRPSVTQKSEVF